MFKRNYNERISKLNDDDFLGHIKSDIVCLLETKADKEDRVSLKGYRLLKHSTRPRKGKGIYGGIAAYAKLNIAKGVTVLKTNSTEYLWLRLDRTFFKHKSDIYLCCVYNSPKKLNLCSETNRYSHNFGKNRKRLVKIFL